jgi:hypothetical protein
MSNCSRRENNLRINIRKEKMLLKNSEKKKKIKSDSKSYKGCILRKKSRLSRRESNKKNTNNS